MRPVLLAVAFAVAIASVCVTQPENLSKRTLTFAQRVSYQRAIEEVYWRHRTWPKERPDPKPSLDAEMSQAQLEKKVADYLRNSQALEDYWRKPIAPEQLQAEMDRMARNTKQPEVLRELFEALRNDPSVIAECLARPVVKERSVAALSAQQRTSRAQSADTNRPFLIPETPPAFHPRAQQNAFRRRGARQQSRSFSRWNQSLRHNPNSYAALAIGCY